MFEPVRMYRVRCDEPGCLARVLDYEDDLDLLVQSPDLDRVHDLLVDPDGTRWARGSRGRLMCPSHAYILEREAEIAQAHDPLF